MRRLCAIVVGAGVGGICAAIKLREIGVDVTIVERLHDFGGTWLSNTYPGSACDIPCQLYHYSFEPHVFSVHGARFVWL